MSRTTLRTLLVGVSTYVLLTVLSFSFGELYVAAWAPILKLESQWLLTHGLLCDSLTLVTRNAKHLIQIHVVTASEIGFEGTTVPVGAAMRSAMLQAYVLSHPVLVYSVLAAWPVNAWRQRIELLLLGIPCVLISTSLDIPFVLAGLIRSLFLDQLAPERLDRDPLVLYYAFMHGGGRLGLAIAAALIAALFVTRTRTSMLVTHIGQSVRQTSQQLNVIGTKTSPG